MATEAQRRPRALLRLPQVRAATGLSRTTIYELERKDSSFPKRVAIGARSVGWHSDEIESWCDARPRKAR